jgi:hypothetical protein
VDSYREDERFTPLGADARVVWGFKVLRLRNPHSSPAAIDCPVEGKRLIGQTLSEASIPARSVGFVGATATPGRVRVWTIVDGAARCETECEQRPGWRWPDRSTAWSAACTRARRMKTLTRAGLAVAPLLACGRLAAQQGAPGTPLPQLAQELFLAETTFAQDRGEVQLTLHARVEDGTHTRLLAEYGITGRFQVQALTPALEGDGEGDEGAYQAGVLYALIPNQAPVALSVTMDVSLQHGQAPQWEPALIAARQFGRVQVHGAATTELGDPADAFTGTLAALFDAGPLTPTLELAMKGAEDDFVVPGLFVHPHEHVEAGVGVPICLGCGQSPRQVRLMLTVER